MTEKKEIPGIRISPRDMERFESMALFERDLRSRGYRAVAGLDEAGRGPLAGPVVAAACILPADTAFYGLNDSKKMTARRRDYLFEKLRKEASAWSIAMVGPQEIDRTNILLATKEAMRRALMELPFKPDLALIDAVSLEGLGYPVLAEPKGDARHNVIAAASVLAKVARDRMMENWDKVYPAYGFASHKGYGTSAHIEAIRRYGPCPIHRRSFLTGITGRQKKESPYQTGLRIEWLIAQELIAGGHKILEHRYKVADVGEIDFITLQKGTIHLVECKGRGESRQLFGGVEEALRPAQIEKIRRAAALWMQEYPDLAALPVVFLYAAAEFDRKGEVTSIHFIPF